MGRNRKRKAGHRPRYRGTCLWKLLSNLPNDGVGRLVTRGSFKWTVEEPCYMRVLEVDLNQKTMHKRTGRVKIPVKVERIWRGVIQPRPVNILSTSYLEDFILVPKSEEEKYIKNTKTPREKGYVYWNAEQRQNIRNMVAQGIPLDEAKQREKERIWCEEDEAAAKNGFPLKEQDSMPSGANSSSAIVYDNYDEFEDGNETDDSFGDNGPEEIEIEIKKRNTNQLLDCRSEQHQN